MLLGEEQNRLVVWNRADRITAVQEAKDSEICSHNDEREWVRTFAVRTERPDIYPHG